MYKLNYSKQVVEEIGIPLGTVYFKCFNLLDDEYYKISVLSDDEVEVIKVCESFLWSVVEISSSIPKCYSDFLLNGSKRGEIIEKEEFDNVLKSIKEQL
ncbi:MAG: hypothetical protein CMH22_05625 [Methylophaga sp.]|nr:hypothetical protein [Methylophaga sp.]|tara:strand:+ start:105697 stop:105993 length:297 start_codon:yes stop_codon:yes gene_type:complete